MELVLHEKDQQLKAVTNNRTIIHTSLKAELDKKEMELESIQQKQKSKILHVSQELEDLLRWKSSQQRKELKEKLASDGARLGRIVVSKVGMRALESWEEGFATHDLEHRKKKLLARQKLLQTRFNEVASQDAAIDASTTSNSLLLDQLEASESVQRHISNCELALKELAQEELSLNDEKAAHIRALKRVAAEDSSRFGSKPKVGLCHVLDHVSVTQLLTNFFLFFFTAAAWTLCFAQPAWQRRIFRSLEGLRSCRATRGCSQDSPT